MALFAIADLHLSFGANKPMDVFPGWENIPNASKKTGGRATVTSGDSVVIAGDVSWAMSLEELVPDFCFLESLPGKKLIIKGNHDYWWGTIAKMNRFLICEGFSTISFIHNNANIVEGVGVCGSRGWFNGSGDDCKILLREAGRLETSITAAERQGMEPVVFLHYPPLHTNAICTEITDVLLRHKVQRCFYGHLHGRAAAGVFEGKWNGIRFRLIACDHTGFTPVAVENT